MDKIKEINTETLRSWLDSNKAVTILDVRPSHERQEWRIPGSIHADVYDQLKARQGDALKDIKLNKATPVVTVCAGGKTSLVAAELLQAQGYDVYNLQGGMKGWSLSWNIASQSFHNFDIIQFRRTGKGCLSYMIISQSEAMVVDASLPAEVYQEYIEKKKPTLKYVADTHIHADHLSRSKQLAELHNADLYLPSNDKVTYPFNSLESSTILRVGKIKIKAIHTPGHTYESACYLVDDKVLLTGDTLFIDGIGRPDLKAENEEAIAKSGLLYQSLQSLLTLDENIQVMPGHTSKPVAFDGMVIASTLKDIKKKIPMLKLDESTFIENILQRIPPTPANYQTIVEYNLQGDIDDINLLDLEAGANRCSIS